MIEGLDVMADKGFLMQQMLAKLGCLSAIPPVRRRNQEQLTAEEAEETHVIANKRIYVENAVRRIKEFGYFANGALSVQQKHLHGDVPTASPCSATSRGRSCRSTPPPRERLPPLPPPPAPPRCRRAHAAPPPTPAPASVRHHVYCVAAPPVLPSPRRPSRPAKPRRPCVLGQPSSNNEPATLTNRLLSESLALRYW